MPIEDLPMVTPAGGNLPKYRQIAAVIEEYLLRTNPPPGTKFFTDRALAEHFLTTPVTVAHSLNYLAENGLLNRKAGSGTYVGRCAPISNRRRRVGIVCHQMIVENQCYVSPILSRFGSLMEERGYECIALRGGPEDYRRIFEEYQLSGIMVFVPRENFAGELAALRRDHVPVVSIGYAMRELPDISFGTDHAASVEAAVRYLYGLGHRRIALSCSLAQASGPVFLRSYRRVMWDLHLPVHPDWELTVTCEGEPVTARLGVLDSLRETGNLPTAILASNVLDAVVLYHYAAKNHLRIPEDLSLIGFDDSELARQLNPPLTVMAQDVAEIAASAARCLLGMIEGREFHYDKDNHKNSTLIERGSCAPVGEEKRKQS